MAGTELSLARDIRTSVGILSAGTIVHAAPSGDGGWLVRLSLTNLGDCPRCRAVVVPADAVVLPARELIEQRARLTVCAHATDAADAANLLAMLGLLGAEDQEPKPATQPKPARPKRRCVVCNQPMAGRRGPKPKGVLREAGDGLCAKCYEVALRAGRAS